MESESKPIATAASTVTEPIASAESALLVGDEYENTVKNIVDMGYPREMVSFILEQREDVTEMTK